jgi:hypothetical protein
MGEHPIGDPDLLDRLRHIDQDSDDRCAFPESDSLCGRMSEHRLPKAAGHPSGKEAGQESFAELIGEPTPSAPFILRGFSSLTVRWRPITDR